MKNLNENGARRGGNGRSGGGGGRRVVQSGDTFSGFFGKWRAAPIAQFLRIAQLKIIIRPLVVVVVLSLSVTILLSLSQSQFSPAQPPLSEILCISDSNNNNNK